MTTTTASPAHWDTDALFQAPAFTESPEHSVDGVRALFYDSIPWQGKPTRVFAYYGCPEGAPGEKFPAIVLVHGGGGSAFIPWVQLWVSRGYAAIAMDTCGCISGGGYLNHPRHEMGGPPGWGGFAPEQVNGPVTDHWTYHAVSAAVLAHSLIRSFPEVDETRIGLTGISWGGYLSCIIASVDSRFRFAVPIYGCGFYEGGGLWGEAQAINPHPEAWLTRWDPAVYLPRVKIPMLWLTGTNDFAFTLESLQKSYRLPAAPRTVTIILRMEHGHGGAGENPEEIHAFANSFLKNTPPLAQVGPTTRTNREASVTFTSAIPIIRAELLFTKDTGPWADRLWDTQPVSLQGNTATAIIPEGVTVYYFNLIDERGLIVSSEHETL